MSSATTKLNNIITKLDENGGLIPYTLELHKSKLHAFKKTDIILTCTKDTSSHTSYKILKTVNGTGYINNLYFSNSGLSPNIGYTIKINVDGVEYEFSQNSNMPGFIYDTVYGINFGAYSELQNYNNFSAVNGNDVRYSGISTPAILKFKNKLIVSCKFASIVTFTATHAYTICSYSLLN